jgi:RimJ/RimL family protein N-acetyltransferase
MADASRPYANRAGGIVRRIDRYTTDRLTARRVCWADFDDAQRLHSDPEVASTLSADGRPLPADTTRRMLCRAVQHWRAQGFGLWMFHNRDTGEFIGRGGLIRYDALDMGGREEVGLA